MKSANYIHFFAEYNNFASFKNLDLINFSKKNW